LNPFDVSRQVKIAPAGVGRVRKGHPWIYAGDVLKEPDGADPVFVHVVDPAGNGMGYAFYSRPSQIRLRLFSREGAPPTEELLRARVAAAAARRGPQRRCDGEGAEASARRVVFGEGDLLPGVVADRYGPVLVLQTLSRGADALKPLLVEILREAVRPAGVLERNDVRTRALEGLESRTGVLWGEAPEEIEIEEDGIRFLVNPRDGQKTGFFLDQRENRAAAEKVASGKTLDCFTNSGGFALRFARKCARSGAPVLAVDISPDAVRQAERNRRLNGFDNLRLREANAFDFLRELERAGEAFDTICLDPPAFAKSRKAVAGARSGYKEINLRALRLLRPEGMLVTSSCSYHMPEAELLRLVCEAAQDCRRPIQVVERRGQADDHPVLGGMPETSYLKCFVIRAL